MVAFPFGPEIGIPMSASPDGPFTFVLPEVNNPSLIGAPSAATTRRSLFARATASLYASDDFMTLNTKKTMQTTNSTASAMRVRQPVGTNHFQFRCHQFRRGGCDVSGGGGGVGELGSIASFCPSANFESSNFCLSSFSVNRRETQNQIRIRPCGTAHKFK